MSTRRPTFQDVILALQEYWAKQGCIIWQPYHTEVGAGTFNPATFLRVLGPDAWKVAYVEPSIRPTDGRYGENPYRLGHYYQYQVILKPCPDDVQQLYLASLEHLGIDLAKHDVRFVEDDWESPTLGAWGLGWEVWIDGMEVTQFTYFQQVGGVDLDPPSVELTYGTERLSMYLQGVGSIFDLLWVPGTTYGDVFRANEAQWSAYNFDVADVPTLQRSFADYERECDRCLAKGLALPAYDFVLKTSHMFNLLDARGAISVTERTGYIARVRNLARRVAEQYVAQVVVERPVETEAPKVRTEDLSVPAGGEGADGARDRAPQDFLLEIGTEEMPASACRAAMDLLPARVAALFAAEGISVAAEDVRVLVSPRRIAILIDGLPGGQGQREQVQRGPAYESAFDAEGKPTAAAAGFARAKGVAVEDLEVREEGGRRFVFLVSRMEGRPTVDLLPDICQRIVRDMYFPKNMRWGYRDLRFSRPVRWLVALFGGEVVPFGVAGLMSGRTSWGHRWLGSSVEISQPSAYVEALRSAGVIVDHRERETLIWSELERVAAEQGLEVADPTGKMEEVLFLVEWPTVLAGRFASQHLRLPAPVLISAMQSHQRYFPLLKEGGSLSERFLMVMNGDPRFAEDILSGNERVLEGRIEDAEFSFEKDLSTGLETMAGSLDRVVFHEKAGTMSDKTRRLIDLVHHLGGATGVSQEVLADALEAARLAKADQVSVMVREFPDLEGVMGETYAVLAGKRPEVAQALREQFLPDAAGGQPPRSLPGALLATAEKVDNVVAAFACGEPPSGSRDPYGLRRAASGMVTIALAHALDYDVEALVTAAYTGVEQFAGMAPRESVVVEAGAFILERLVKQLSDEGIARDTVEAVLPTSRSFLDLRARAVAIQAVRGTPTWEDLVTAATRPANLARKLPESDALGAVDPGRFVVEAERELHEAWRGASAKLAEARAAGRYRDALSVIAGLRPFVDRYFADVLVMADDEGLRVNRLRQLSDIAAGVRRLVRLELIQG